MDNVAQVGPHCGLESLTWGGGHKLVERIVPGNGIEKWSQGTAHPQKAMSSLRSCDVAHLHIRNVQQLSQLLPVCSRLVEQQ